RPRRARRPPPRDRLLRRRRPRGQADRGHARRGGRRRLAARDQVPPPPGRRLPRLGARRQRRLGPRRRPRGGDRGARQELRARRAMAPRGGRDEHRDRRARRSRRAHRAGRRRPIAPAAPPREAPGPRLYSPRVRLSKAIRATAWGMVAAGIAAPLIRKRVQAPPLLTQAVAFSAPVGLAIAVRRSPRRDVAICALQMWAYLAAYKAPHDDASGQAARVHIKYPIVGDRILGLGKLPTTRLQRALARTGPDGAGGPEFSALDRVLVWAHWSWFLIPHGSLLYILVRHPRRFSRAAVLTYAVFDVGASFYWVIPTAPPWYAAGAREDSASGEQLEVRRMMVEYGEHFWR